MRICVGMLACMRACVHAHVCGSCVPVSIVCMTNGQTGVMIIIYQYPCLPDKMYYPYYVI